jgi:hypothetical protein
VQLERIAHHPDRAGHNLEIQALRPRLCRELQLQALEQGIQSQRSHLQRQAPVVQPRDFEQRAEHVIHGLHRGADLHERVGRSIDRHMLAQRPR